MIDIINKVWITIAFLSLVMMIITAMAAGAAGDAGVKIDEEQMKFGFVCSFIIFLFTFIFGIVFTIWTW